ncbi:lipase maturation factor family protein [Streptomyces ipomoeae]|uniref:Lipase maturation factor family protein n=2 Tax=Streptomyces ipomoeae TaxID=103232 RepID=A0AAE8W389_9ACTN|nr:lipase maturation factor family protein [Streptomyces ipomoeae]EKX62904.1 putative membrane protein [Streptomyces ipomoeae 91-03]MDX2695536.1 lipase maturation factor family protein [Streptomyces ipomoeae]MDX2840605.1 lipase maturation factor family protein [Streptomyces ipomoeae]TQE35341.1 lipase maturation factor family protein [Streptomyces ipomoeae]TQE37670.1 lipase maturation factor family protein [Streptomyces ipomoeae]
MEWFTAPDYELSRLLFQRALAVIYLVAFLAASLQFRALLGERGMLPIPRFVERVPFRASPSVFHLHYSDRFFAAWAWTGCAVSLALVAGLDSLLPLWGGMLLWLVPWAMYLSIVNVGQTWYSFGWESLLLEVGFLAVFLGNDEVAPPIVVLFLLRWVLFRVEFGAGLIKMRGDACWRKLTCLDHHHETQPMPGPLSWFFHHLPKPFHRVEVAANHVTQLVVPVLLFTPQPIATAAAALMILTQLWLVLSGNFSWLNWITIVLALPAIDFGTTASKAPGSPLWYEIVVLAVTALVLWLSYHPVRNMISRRQIMNRSFDPLHLVNTYGAFGSVSRVRYEVVVEGTADDVPREDSEWLAYEFKGKPGDPRRWPRQFAPYHLRLDWLMWFAALSPAYAGAWFGTLVERLLENDRDTLRLLRRSPFPADAPPRFVRARLFRYRYTTWRELRETGACWERTYVREFMPPTRLAGSAARRS